MGVRMCGPIADLSGRRHEVGKREEKEKGKEKKNCQQQCNPIGAFEFASNASSITAFEKASRASTSGRLLEKKKRNRVSKKRTAAESYLHTRTAWRPIGWRPAARDQ